MKKVHVWNKQRLNGSIQEAIEKKEMEILNLSKRLNNCESLDILKAKIDLENLLYEEENF